MFGQSAGAGSLGTQSMKLRNTFGTVQNRETYEGLRVSLSTGSYIRCNDRFFGVPWVVGSVASGSITGNLAIFPIGKHGKADLDRGFIEASSQQLLDFDFYKFESNIVATATRDGLVKVFRFPEDGVLEGNATVADSYLAGHEKKVDHVRFHPSATDLLLSASSDQTVRLWDFRSMQEVVTLSDPETTAQDIYWSPHGSVVLQTGRDGSISMFDPRAQTTPVLRHVMQDFATSRALSAAFLNYDGYDLVVSGFA
ncbi:hypothetical protein H696_01304 [Fonticula alba]|uniref:Coronin n=1 Tax=Fonticula alba TaxID=691883 RepID=A0A058ZBU4_FONAL|nr:hypothetical protein H696_01304 [Fonticula alba]KCV71895.1 hypothetical protein H696_01304 [Fonticula alba]|eukprot:XP_009493473.1 hypothetical protein H696_01304 [Fonticula alba]